MLKVIFAAILSVCASGMAAASESLLCLKNIEIKINRLHPKIYLSGEIERKDSIFVKRYADCKTGRLKEPSTYAEAIEWLDLALPFDFKSGITGGDYLNAYIYTEYGESVEEDLFGYFTASWHLGPNSTICKAPSIANEMMEDKNQCFFYLMDKLRESYKNPKRADPLE